VKTSWSLVWCAGLMVMMGCAGKGERIDVTLPGKFTGLTAQVQSSAGPRIAVLPFEDKRAHQDHLGTRSHLWGGVSYFDLPSGTVGKSTAQSLVDYLNRQGWRASLARTQGSEGADVTIAGTVQELSIDAKSGIMHTDLSAKNAMTFQITNHSDESSVRERVSGTGTDQVFWFDSEDAQFLTTELLEKNFQKFLGDLKVDGRALRLK
jgi:hypothetical protein